MPNWITGSLKLRGSYDNIINFFENGLNVYHGHWNSDTGEYKERVVPKSDWLKMEEFSANGGRECDITISNYWAYIEGTKRAFISDGTWLCIDDSDSPTVASMEINQAWGFKAEEFLEIAKKYNLDIRLWGLESGMGFGQEIVIENEELMKDQIIKYEDFQWEAPMPWLGG